MSIEQKPAEYTKLVNEMGTYGATAQRVATQYEAHMSLFRVAASNQDAEDMEKTRATLHGLLDSMLDACMSLGKLQQQAEAVLREIK